MAFVFVSYRHPDRPRVVRLVTALRAAGVDVWWDGDLPGGSTFRKEIEEKLRASGCVLVCWSTESVAPEATFVRDEAEWGRGRGVLLPVLLDRVVPPLGFGEYHALPLDAWHGDPGDPWFTDVLAAVRAKLAHERPPPPRAPARHRRKAASRTALALLVGMPFALATNLGGLQRATCMLPGLHTVCGELGLGGVADAEQEAAWTALQAAPSCEAYEAYLQRWPAGVYAAAAKASLDAAARAPDEAWLPRETPLMLPLYVARPLAAAPGEAEAREAADPTVGREAATACDAYSASGAYRVTAATPEPAGWACVSEADGWRCGFDGKVACGVDERVSVRHCR